MRLPDPEKSYAVFIGTTTYSGELADRPIAAARTNVADLVDVLAHEEHGGFRRDHCVELVDQHDANHVLRALKAVADKATDTLLVYLVGHGLPKDPAGNEMFLFLPGADPADPLWWREALPYGDVRDIIRGSAAGNRIVVLDTCFAGRVLPESMGGDVEQLFDVAGAYTLTSVGPNDRSIAPLGDRHTSFTGELIRLLTDGIDAHGDLLSLPNLFQHLKATQVAKNARPPHHHVTGTAENLAVVRNRARVVRWVLPEALVTAIGSPINTVRRDALAELADLYYTGSPAIRDRAREEVERLIDDDSILVATEAKRLLSQFNDGNGTPPPPPVTPLWKRFLGTWPLVAAALSAIVAFGTLAISGYPFPQVLLIGFPITALGCASAGLTTARMNRSSTP